MENIISFSSLNDKLSKEDRELLSDLIKRITRCQACMIIDNWKDGEQDLLVYKEIIRCITKYNEFIEKTGAGAIIPIDNIEKIKEITVKLVFDFIGEKQLT
jgi:hypothetical protein